MRPTGAQYFQSPYTRSAGVVAGQPGPAGQERERLDERGLQALHLAARRIHRHAEHEVIVDSRPRSIEQAGGQPAGSIAAHLARGLHETVDVLVEQAKTQHRPFIEVPLEAQIDGLGAQVVRIAEPAAG